MPAWKAASISANASSSVSPWPKKSGAEPIPPKFPQPSAIRATASPGSSPCISLAAYPELAAVAAVAAALAAATAAIISSIALRTASDAQLPWAISAARARSCRLDSW